MNKKSKVLMIGAAVAAITVFTATALATTPKTTGYEAFKEVLKANQMSGHTIDSATIRGNFSVTLDGETVLTADSTTKVKDAADENRMSSDFDFTFKGVERSGSLYSNGDDSIYFIDRTHDLHYQVVNLEEEHTRKHKDWQQDADDYRDRPLNDAEEALFDFMVGDLKDNFGVTDDVNGSRVITVDVSKEEIPLPLRLLMDVASAEGNREHAHAPEVSAEWERMKQLPFFQGLEEVDLENQLPKLTEDIVIERVKLQFIVDRNNELEGMQGVLEVSGKDKAGVAHRVIMEGRGDFSDRSITTPDVYDPAGKSIGIIDATTFDDRG